MLHFCTVSDKNYLLKGLALYKSLEQTMTSGTFKLYWLCMDQETYDQLDKLDLIGVRPFLLSDLEAADPVLAAAKNNKPSRFGTQYENYCWALCPYFTHYILTTFLSSYEKLFYVDSDIFFYRSPREILEIVGDKAIGLHTHRFSGRIEDNVEVGWFNIGVVVFANNELGRTVATAWKQWLLHTDNPSYDTHGHCGDQKYAELFPTLIGWDNVCVFDQAGIMHLAPWCTDNQEGRPVSFFHFSHFQFNLSDNSWKDSIHGEWAPAQNPNIRHYYENYFNTILELSKFEKHD